MEILLILSTAFLSLMKLFLFFVQIFTKKGASFLIGYFIMTFILLVPMIIFGAWLIGIVWNFAIVPTFGVASLTWIQQLALEFVVTFLAPSPQYVE
jgi:hypothetical protein